MDGKDEVGPADKTGANPGQAEAPSETTAFAPTMQAVPVGAKAATALLLPDTALCEALQQVFLLYIQDAVAWLKGQGGLPLEQTFQVLEGTGGFPTVEMWLPTRAAMVHSLREAQTQHAASLTNLCRLINNHLDRFRNIPLISANPQAQDTVHPANLVFEPIVSEYFRRKQTLDSDEPLLTAILHEAWTELDQDTATLYHVSPLINIMFESDEIVLSRGLRIRRTQRSDRERWVNTWSHAPLHDAFRASHVVEETETIPCSQMMGSATMDRYSRVVAALRLLTACRVQTAFIETFRCGIFKGGLHKTGDSGMEAFPAALVVASEEAELLRYYKGLRSQLPAKHSLALRRWMAGLERKSAEDALLDYWIGLECLFTGMEKSELMFRAALRIAHFLGHTAVERVQLFTDMKHSYHIRSQIVHGEDSVNLQESATKTRQCLRQALIQLIMDKVPFDVDQFERELLRRSAQTPLGQYAMQDEEKT